MSTLHICISIYDSYTHTPYLATMISLLPSMYTHAYLAYMHFGLHSHTHTLHVSRWQVPTNSPLLMTRGQKGE